MSATEQYLVDVIGFNPTERLMLRASSPWPPGATRASCSARPARRGRADIYLVDADDSKAMNEFQAVRKRATRARRAGRCGRGDSTGLPVLPRPLQWARLLQALEDALQGAAPAATDHEKTMVAAAHACARRAGAYPGAPTTATAAPSASRTRRGSRVLGDTRAGGGRQRHGAHVHEGQAGAVRLRGRLRRDRRGGRRPDRHARIHLRVPGRGAARHRRLPGLQADQGQQAGDQEDRGGDAHQPQLAVRQAARLARRLRRVPDQAARRGPPARGDRQVPSLQPQARRAPRASEEHEQIDSGGGRHPLHARDGGRRAAGRRLRGGGGRRRRRGAGAGAHARVRPGGHRPQHAAHGRRDAGARAARPARLRRRWR